MIAQIKNGGKVMPALGSQLSDRDIANVIAYIRETFGATLSGPPKSPVRGVLGTMADVRKAQDCAAQGRRNCATIDASGRVETR